MNKYILIILAMSLTIFSSQLFAKPVDLTVCRDSKIDSGYQVVFTHNPANYDEMFATLSTVSIVGLTKVGVYPCAVTSQPGGADTYSQWTCKEGGPEGYSIILNSGGLGGLIFADIYVGTQPVSRASCIEQ